MDGLPSGAEAAPEVTCIPRRRSAISSFEKSSTISKFPSRPVPSTTGRSRKQQAVSLAAKVDKLIARASMWPPVENRFLGASPLRPAVHLRSGFADSQRVTIPLTHLPMRFEVESFSKKILVHRRKLVTAGLRGQFGRHVKVPIAEPVGGDELRPTDAVSHYKQPGGRDDWQVDHGGVDARRAKAARVGVNHRNRRHFEARLASFGLRRSIEGPDQEYCRSG